MDGLLAPTRRVHARGPGAHDGTIGTTAPEHIWGTDATRLWHGTRLQNARKTCQRLAEVVMKRLGVVEDG